MCVEGAVGGLVDGHAIALVEQAVEVAVAAAAAAEGLVLLVARLAAQRAAARPRGGAIGHGRLLSFAHRRPVRAAGREPGDRTSTRTNPSHSFPSRMHSSG